VSDDLNALLGLLLCKGVGRRVVRRVVADVLREGGTDWDASRRLRREFGATPGRANDIGEQLAEVRRLGLGVIRPGDAQYPSILDAIPDPPVALFVSGSPAALVKPLNIAIVGSRRATIAGRQFARSLSSDLGRAGLVVVSGLAAGIDGAAHRGAIEAHSTTIAVVGGGLCRIYPAGHRGLANEIVATGGAIVTEYPPTSTPRPANFPERNRIISGLTAGVVVVEASTRSGSLITARMALEQGREVMAVPGHIAAGSHAGCHRLIKQGAALVEDSTDVLQMLGLEPSTAVSATPSTHPLAHVLNAVHSEVATLHDIVESLAMPVQEVLGALVELELDGFVESVRGGYIRRLHSSVDRR
jgi:DNA processing protein